VADHYPTVTHLAFNDLSTRSYDNQTDVNLAVMTVFYTGGTWYQKHIGAIIAPESMEYLENHMRYYREAKHIPWDIMSDTITDHRHRVNDMESLYYSANTWEEFFQSLYNRLGGIRPFCLFVSEWIDRFIAKYFNNLRGLTYWMPVKAINLLYRIRPFTVDICSVQKHPSTSLFYPILSRNS
jgi:hypothetical protein